MRVGFVGLGDQGLPIAQRIVAGGIACSVWARNPAALEPFGSTTATIASSLRELGATCDVVAVCVYDADGVREVLFGDDGVVAAMRPGGAVMIHSTITPADVRELGQMAAEHGVGLLDAPVSGGRAMATAGRLVVMVGGDDTLIARCRPVLETFCDTIVPAGDVGAGQMVKLLNNTLMSANLAVALDAFDLAREAGVDPAALARVLDAGSGQSYAASLAAQGHVVLAMTGRPRVTLLKDLGLMVATVGPRAAGGALVSAAAAGLDHLARVAHQQP